MKTLPQYLEDMFMIVAREEEKATGEPAQKVAERYKQEFIDEALTAKANPMQKKVPTKKNNPSFQHARPIDIVEAMLMMGHKPVDIKKYLKDWHKYDASLKGIQDYANRKLPDTAGASPPLAASFRKKKKFVPLTEAISNPLNKDTYKKLKFVLDEMAIDEHGDSYRTAVEDGKIYIEGLLRIPGVRDGRKILASRDLLLAEKALNAGGALILGIHGWEPNKILITNGPILWTEIMSKYQTDNLKSSAADIFAEENPTKNPIKELSRLFFDDPKAGFEKSELGKRLTPEERKKVWREMELTVQNLVDPMLEHVLKLKIKSSGDAASSLQYPKKFKEMTETQAAALGSEVEKHRYMKMFLSIYLMSLLNNFANISPGQIIEFLRYMEGGKTWKELRSKTNRWAFAKATKAAIDQNMFKGFAPANLVGWAQTQKSQIKQITAQAEKEQAKIDEKLGDYGKEKLAEIRHVSAESVMNELKEKGSKKMREEIEERVRQSGKKKKSPLTMEEVEKAKAVHAKGLAEDKAKRVAGLIDFDVIIKSLGMMPLAPGKKGEDEKKMLEKLIDFKTLALLMKKDEDDLRKAFGMWAKKKS